MGRPCCADGVAPRKTWNDRPVSEYRSLVGKLAGGIRKDVAIDGWGDEPPTILLYLF